jgi:hypoxanthine phosphoribosyltransferase
MHLSDEVLLSRETIATRVAELASEIAGDTPPGGTLSVLAILDGAFVFCADLVRALDRPLHVGLMRVVSVARGGDPDSAALPDDLPLRGADLLVVEDILDTGHTLAALRRRLLALEPARLRIAVLLDKPSRREVAVPVDYVGFEVPDRWVVGYGLDSDGLYRNLPEIRWLAPERE